MKFRFATRMWERDKKVFLGRATSCFWPPLAQGLLYLIALGYGLGNFVAEIDGMPYMMFIAPGLVAATAMNIATATCSYEVFGKIEWTHEYFSILTTPLTANDVVFGEILWGSTLAVIQAGLLLCLFACFGLITSSYALFVPIILFIEAMGFSAMGMLFTGLIKNFHSINYLGALVISPMFFFSDIFFPIASLHPYFQVIAWFFPLYHAVEPVRALCIGKPTASVFTDILWLVIFALLMCLFSIKIMNRRLVK